LHFFLQSWKSNYRLFQWAHLWTGSLTKEKVLDCIAVKILEKKKKTFLSKFVRPWKTFSSTNQILYAVKELEIPKHKFRSNLLRKFIWSWLLFKKTKSHQNRKKKNSAEVSEHSLSPTGNNGFFVEKRGGKSKKRAENSEIFKV
jgi:hypothetical protein